MANALFLLDTKVDNATTLTASTSAAAMPVSNLQSEARSVVWRSGAGTSSYVDITLGSTASTTCVALVDLNLTTAGTIRTQAWTDSINGSVLVLDRTDKPNVYGYVQTQYTYGGGAYGVGPYGSGSVVVDTGGRNVTLISLDAPIQARYWRITLTDGNTTYQQCTRIFLTIPKTYVHNISYGWEVTRRERSIKKESLGGQRYVQRRDSRGVINATFDFLSESERADVLLLMQSFGEIKPLVFSVFPVLGAQGLTTTLYGTLESPKVQNQFYQISSFPFSVVEEF